MPELPPGIMGAGLTGRPQVRPVDSDLERPIGEDEQGNPVYAQEAAEGASIPGQCLRVLNTPLTPGYGGECPYDCPGRQEDGGCLADLVRWANDNGVEWSFEVRLTESGPQWVYTGEEH